MENQHMTKQECMEKYDVLLRLLSEMQSEESYWKKVFDLLEKIPAAGAPGDITGVARAKAIAKAIGEKERTNRRLLAVYAEMYEDLRRVLFGTEESEPEAIVFDIGEEPGEEAPDASADSSEEI